MHTIYFRGIIDDSDLALIKEPDQIHHLRNVLRLKVGDLITVFDSSGRQYLCSIIGIERQKMSLKVVERKPARPSGFKLDVACAVPKNSRLDDIVDKLTQIGVDTIFPLLTERVVAKVNEAGQSRLERWRKIARSAAEQSGRNTLPSIPDILLFKDIISQSTGYDLRLIPNLEGERLPLNKVLANKKPSAVLVMIGPEGDFSPGEISQAVNAGFLSITLGENVLRVDTAAISVAAYIKFALG